MTILETIYDHIITECTSCGAIFSDKNREKIRQGTLQVYRDRDKLKMVASTSDFPCMEIRHTALTESQSSSSCVVCNATWQITMATGVFDYETRLFPLELAFLAIARRLKQWRFQAPDKPGTRVIGALVSPISVGRISQDGMPDNVKGWVLQFTYDVRFTLDNSDLQNIYNGDE